MMAAKLTSDRAGFVRTGSNWVCKLLIGDNRPCNQIFSCKKKQLFEQHRLDEHHQHGPLPVLKPYLVAIYTEEEQKAKHAARQAKYAAKLSADVLEEKHEAKKMKKLVEKYREIFDTRLLRTVSEQPVMSLPGIMTFLNNGLSHRPGRLDESTGCVDTMWDLAKHKLILVSLVGLCQQAISPDNISQSALRSFVEHAGLSFRVDSLSW